MRTKKGEKEKRRTLILEKAISYLKEHGRGEAAADDIMKHAGLTKGALYSHFKSKDDLFAHAVCHDLKKLETRLGELFQEDELLALKTIIELHLSKESLTNVGESCAFTSLSSDMQRCSPSHRALYEKFMDRIYKMFADALQKQFPKDSPAKNYGRALNLYSGLVGTLTMARTMKDPKRADDILKSGRDVLIWNFLPKSIRH